MITTATRHRARRNAVLVLATILAFVLTWIGPASVAVSFPRIVPSSPVHPVASSTCTDGVMVVVAHEDDDLLFTSPDLAADVADGRCVRTVFLTAGDAAQGTDYWEGREAGSEAAYASMAGVADRWTLSSTLVLGQPLRTLTLRGEPQVSLVFVRLPDGNRSGTGMAVHDHESLMKLWLGSITAIHAVDGSATFTADDLTRTLSAMIAAFAPVTVRTMDWTRDFRTGDNADHTATALFTRSAAQDAAAATNHRTDLMSYEGYPAWTRPPNVAGDGLRRKAAAVTSYAPHDPMLCLEAWCPLAVVTSARVARQYVVDEEHLPADAQAPPP